MTAVTFIRIGATCGKIGLTAATTGVTFAATGVILQKIAATCARTYEAEITKTPAAINATFAMIGTTCGVTAGICVLTAAIPAPTGKTCVLTDVTSGATAGSNVYLRSRLCRGQQRRPVQCGDSRPRLSHFEYPNSSVHIQPTKGCGSLVRLRNYPST